MRRNSRVITSRAFRPTGWAVVISSRRRTRTSSGVRSVTTAEAAEAWPPPPKTARTLAHVHEGRPRAGDDVDPALHGGQEEEGLQPLQGEDLVDEEAEVGDVGFGAEGREVDPHAAQREGLEVLQEGRQEAHLLLREPAPQACGTPGRRSAAPGEAREDGLEVHGARGGEGEEPRVLVDAEQEEGGLRRGRAPRPRAARILHHERGACPRLVDLVALAVEIPRPRVVVEDVEGRSRRTVQDRPQGRRGAPGWTRPRRRAAPPPRGPAPSGGVSSGTSPRRSSRNRRTSASVGPGEDQRRAGVEMPRRHHGGERIEVRIGVRRDDDHGGERGAGSGAESNPPSRALHRRANRESHSRESKPNTY